MTPLAKSLRKVSAFLKSASFQKLILRKEPFTEEFALMVMDVQRRYCLHGAGCPGTPETEAMADRIASLVPLFRAAGAKVYAIYYPYQRGAIAGFHKFTPEKNDIRVEKNDPDVFQGSDISRKLDRHAKKPKLLVCGFYASACIKKSVLTALGRDYDVTVLEDMVGDWLPAGAGSITAESLRKMEDAGARIAPSQSVLMKMTKKA